MSSRSKASPTAERAAIDEATSRLPKGFKVDRSLGRGAAEPDMIIRGPRGETYVVEVKLGRGTAHFGTLAQLTHYQDFIQVARTSKVRPILVTNMDVPDSIADAAHALKVTIIRTSDNPSEIARSLGESLDNVD